MKNPVLRTIGLLGIIVVVVIVMRVATSRPGLNTGAGLETETREGLQGSAESSRHKPEEEAVETQGLKTWKTKVRERPSAEEQAKKRLERRRIEIVEALEEYKIAGMGEKHPMVVKATNDLEKIEAEQAGAGQPATRSESDSEGGDKPQPEAEGRSR